MFKPKDASSWGVFWRLGPGISMVQKLMFVATPYCIIKSAI
jgi:hypothetical protein